MRQIKQTHLVGINGQLRANFLWNRPKPADHLRTSCSLHIGKVALVRLHSSLAIGNILVLEDSTAWRAFNIPHSSWVDSN